MIQGINFSIGNGEKGDEKYAHKIQENESNCYQELIREAGNILIDYSQAKQIECYGFGGVCNFENFKKGISHFFPLSGILAETKATGVSGALEYYHQAVANVDPSGPIFLAFLLKEIIKKIQKIEEEAKKYHVLLLAVTEDIHDIYDVIDLIIQISYDLPISVIIIGMGDSPYKGFQRLSEGSKLLRDKDGKVAKRECYQFVEVKKCGGSVNKAVQLGLGNVPYDIVEYFKMKGVNP